MKDSKHAGAEVVCRIVCATKKTLQKMDGLETDEELEFEYVPEKDEPKKQPPPEDPKVGCVSSHLGQCSSCKFKFAVDFAMLSHSVAQGCTRGGSV